MKILLLGSGGRESALARVISLSKKNRKIIHISRKSRYESLGRKHNS